MAQEREGVVEALKHMLGLEAYLFLEQRRGGAIAQVYCPLLPGSDCDAGNGSCPAMWFAKVIVKFKLVNA